MLLLLLGCPWMGPQRYEDVVQDHDGDGFVAERFGGPDCVDDDPSIGDCDADGDGVRTLAAGGTDCDDQDATVYPGAPESCDGVDEDCDGLVDDDDPDLADAPLWYADDDLDGYGDPDAPRRACADPGDRFTDDATDCDDDRADVYPGAPEFCDDLDRNCNGDPYDAADQDVWVPDADGDGFGPWGVPEQLQLRTCEPPSGYAPLPPTASAADCDDTRADAFPGAPEVFYDGVDQACDGGDDFDLDGDGWPLASDCDDTDPTRSPGAPEICNDVDDDCDGDVDDDDDDLDDPVRLTWYVDGDGDGFGGDDSVVLFCPGFVPNGYVPTGGDCDDTFQVVNPAGTEVCDDRDNNCNGAVDEGAVDRRTYYQDADGDGHGTALVPVLACDADPGSGVSAFADDCNDADPDTYPGAPEVCGDAFRQDCSTLSPYDCDGDGYEDEAFGGTDCDDERAAVNPAATEICDGLDNDCDDRLDDQDPSVDLSTIADWYRDADEDGFGDPTDLVLPAACAPVPGAAANPDDCDDTDDTVFPGAPERCDDLDNDCDALVDDEDTDSALLDPPDWYLDNDGDGFGDPSIVWTQTCDAPTLGAWVLDGSDCQPGQAAINPWALEICDGLDNDCDGLTDAADPGAALDVWYLDADGDGWGQASSALAQCGQPAGHVAVAGDCNDLEAAANPGADEVCDGGLDNDCDGLADDQDPDLATATTWFADADGDGYGDPLVTLAQCGQPPGHVPNALDCDDGAASVNPTATEVCNAGVDDDCDGLADDLDPSFVGGADYWLDGDLDGFGDPLSAPVTLCAAAPGFVRNDDDCDDALASVSPAAPEVCNAGVDDDCDGLADTADPTLTGGQIRYLDLDGDGRGNPYLSAQVCGPTPGYVTSNDDCNDGDPGVYPGSPDVCDGVDNDCSGVADDSPLYATTWWQDSDGDGAGNPTVQVNACVPPLQYVDNPGDCDDANPNRAPGRLEVCDGVDNDCDAFADDQDPQGPDVGNTFFVDDDGDGWGDGGAPVIGCAVGPGQVAQVGDCDDTDPDLYPGQELVVAPVGTPYTDIGAALAAACDDVTITLLPSIPYPVTAPIDPNGKRFTLRGSDPDAPAVLDAPLVGPVIRIDGTDARGSLIENVELRSGAVTPLADVTANEVTFRGVTFADHQLLLIGDGAGLKAQAGATVVCDDCRFTNNLAPNGGGISVNNSTLYLLGGVLTENTGTSAGGGLFASNATVFVVGTRFEGNTGGAWRVVGGSLDLIDVAVLDDDGPISENGVTFASGLELVRSGPLQVRNAGQPTFADLNHVLAIDPLTNGIQLETATATVRNAEVRNAAANGIAVLGGDATIESVTSVGHGNAGVLVSFAVVDLRNGLFWGGTGAQDVSVVSATPTVAYSLFATAGEAAAFGGTNTGGIDPLLQTWHPNLPSERWDLHLQDIGIGRYSGDPALITPDGATEVGAYGGPGGDWAWYQNVDTPVDGLPDGWERQWFGTTTRDGNGDFDSDGWLDSEEFVDGTDPTEADTDRDGVIDASDTAPLDPLTP